MFNYTTFSCRTSLHVLHLFVTNTIHLIDNKLVTVCRKWLFYQFLFSFYIFDSRTLFGLGEILLQKELQANFLFQHSRKKNYIAAESISFRDLLPPPHPHPFLSSFHDWANSMHATHHCGRNLRNSRQVQRSTCYVKPYTTILAEGMFPHKPPSPH